MTLISTFKKILSGSAAEVAPLTSVEERPTTKSLPLKVKILNLAAEAGIIRAEEERVLGHIRALDGKSAEAWVTQHRYTYFDLKNHREGVVREEARDTLLAYGFLRGRSYKAMERVRYSEPNWDNVERMILKYGNGVGSSQTREIRQQVLKQAFAQWIDEAGPVAVRGPRKPRIRPSKKAEAAA